MAKQMPIRYNYDANGITKNILNFVRERNKKGSTCSYGVKAGPQQPSEQEHSAVS